MPTPRTARRALAALALSTVAGACAPREETTPLGYVVAPSVPPGDGGASPGAPPDPDAGSARYSRAAPASDARK